jgi:hypothetical protein
LALRVDRNDAMEKLLILATAVELLEPSQADGDGKYERR